MLKDITLGQYFPGNSLVHTADPRIKLLSVFLFIAAIFAAGNAYGYVLMYGVLALVIVLSGIPFRTILKSIRPILYILLFTAAANLLLTTGQTPLVSFWFIRIYPEGIRFAVYMALRILCLVIGTFVILTYTTSPVALTDAVERLLSPLARIGVPTHEFAMMMTIALRFIPTLIEETDKIMSAQKSRGADFESGSLMSRAKALIPILVPLFVSSFRRADELAAAMECRLYHGGEGRTRMKVLRLTITDVFVLLFFLAMLTVVIYFNICFGKTI